LKQQLRNPADRSFWQNPGTLKAKVELPAVATWMEQADDPIVQGID
jgi:hypothetical protein